jgi:hypothetical protein
MYTQQQQQQQQQRRSRSYEKELKRKHHPALAVVWHSKQTVRAKTYAA